MAGAWLGKPDAGYKLSMSSPCNSTAGLCPHPATLSRAASLNHPTGSRCLKLRRPCRQRAGGKHKFTILRLTRSVVSRNLRILRHNFPVVRRNSCVLRFTMGGFPCPAGIGNGNFIKDVSKVETNRRR